MNNRFRMTKLPASNGLKYQKRAAKVKSPAGAVLDVLFIINALQMRASNSCKIQVLSLWMFSIKQVEAEILFTGFVTSGLILTNV